VNDLNPSSVNLLGAPNPSFLMNLECRDVEGVAVAGLSVDELCVCDVIVFARDAVNSLNAELVLSVLGTSLPLFLFLSFSAFLFLTISPVLSLISTSI